MLAGARQVEDHDIRSMGLTTLAAEARNLAPHPPPTGETATAHAPQQNRPGSPRPRVDSTRAVGFLV